MRLYREMLFVNLLYEVLRQNFSYSIILVRVTNASCCRTSIFVRIFYSIRNSCHFQHRYIIFCITKSDDLRKRNIPHIAQLLKRCPFADSFLWTSTKSSPGNTTSTSSEKFVSMTLRISLRTASDPSAKISLVGFFFGW